MLYEFKCEPASLHLTHVAASTRMTNEQVAKMRNVMTTGSSGSAPSLEITGTDEVTELLELRLRWLEARLSFGNHGDALDSIELWGAEFEFIPETAEEQSVVAVTSFRVQERERPPSRVRISPGFLSSVVHQLANYDDELAFLQGFYREARNHFIRQEYIEAFHDYYFVIEGQYADGQSGEKQVMRAFLSSDRLRDIAERSLEAFRTEPRLRVWLEASLDSEGLPHNMEGVLRLLFRIRGDLRHFSPRTPRKVITPYNKREFRTAALLAMHVATQAIGYRMADPASAGKP